MNRPGTDEAKHREVGFLSPQRLALCFGATGVLVHLVTNGRYGYFRDELYFLDCGRHLDWGYVDQPPLIALLARGSTLLFGDSQFAIRIFPALAAGTKLWLTGLIAIAFGGRRSAVVLGCFPVLVAPGFLVADSRLSMNAFEPVFWMGSAYFLALAIRRQQPRLLLWVGGLAGLGLENKYSMLFFLLALAVGLAWTPERSLYKSGWLWAGAGVALLVFLPNLLWEASSGWPTLEFLENVKRGQRGVEIAPLAFLWKQFSMLQPLASLVWLPGLWFLIATSGGRQFRCLGWAYLLILTFYLAMKGKDYYVLPAYPMLFAAGGVFWEGALSRSALGGVAKTAFLALLGLGGLLKAPFAVPILPITALLHYQDALGVTPRNADPHQRGRLPQHFGDEFGWEEMVRTVAKLYRGLSPAEQAQTAILTRNYGEAGAIDFFGPRYGLPNAISGHQNYFLWGPAQTDGTVMILLQWDRPAALEMCQSVEDGPEIDTPFSMEEERYRVLVCRRTRRPLAEVWETLKRWN